MRHSRSSAAWKALFGIWSGCIARSNRTWVYPNASSFYAAQLKHADLLNEALHLIRNNYIQIFSAHSTSTMPQKTLKFQLLTVLLPFSLTLCLFLILFTTVQSLIWIPLCLSVS